MLQITRMWTVLNKQQHICTCMFFNYEMGHDNENETKFWKSRSKYAVSNDSHFTVHREKLTFDVDGAYEFH